MSLRQTIQQVIEKVLTWAGFRVEGRFLVHQINVLWEQCKSTFITSIAQSTRNKFDEVQVGLNENVEVLAPAFSWGNVPYNGQPTFDFFEGKTYQVGDQVEIGSSYYPCPSLIADTEGNQHVVFPVWAWTPDGGYQYWDTDNSQLVTLTAEQAQTVTGNDDDGYFYGTVQVFKTGSFGFKTGEFTFRHNASYKGGDLDSHKMVAITLSGSASAAQTITGLQTTTEVKVGQMGQFETTVNGVTKPWPCIVTAVTEPAQEGDPYTFSLLSVSEASGPVDNLQLYQAV